MVKLKHILDKYKRIEDQSDDEPEQNSEGSSDIESLENGLKHASKNIPKSTKDLTTVEKDNGKFPYFLQTQYHFLDITLRRSSS